MTHSGCWVTSSGYGPQPDEVVQRLREEGADAILGNHDAAALGRLEIDAFNDDARAAILWTAGQLGREARRWLGNLPERLTHDEFTLSHGSPREPLWEYLLSPSAARRSFRAFDTPHCLVGHTHMPLAFRDEDGRLEIAGPLGW